MKIIATTNEGVLIEATQEEVKEILNAVTGKRPEKLNIGDKIPAIDYASTISKIKQLKSTTAFVNLISYANNFSTMLEVLKEKVDSASNIEA